MKKIRRGLWEYKGFKIERYEDGDLKGAWDIVLKDERSSGGERWVTGPFRRLKTTVKSLDERLKRGW